jgi:hypothetical protein
MPSKKSRIISLIANPPIKKSKLTGQSLNFD